MGSLQVHPPIIHRSTVHSDCGTPMCSLFNEELNLRNIKSARPTLLIVVIDHPHRWHQRCSLIVELQTTRRLISPSHSAMIPNHRQNQTAGVYMLKYDGSLIDLTADISPPLESTVQLLHLQQLRGNPIWPWFFLDLLRSLYVVDRRDSCNPKPANYLRQVFSIIWLCTKTIDNHRVMNNMLTQKFNVYNNNNFIHLQAQLQISELGWPDQANPPHSSTAHSQTPSNDSLLLQYSSNLISIEPQLL